MYKYPLLSETSFPSQKETLQQFATTGYEQAEALTVLPPKSLISKWLGILIDNFKELHELVSALQAKASIIKSQSSCCYISCLLVMPMTGL